MNGSELPPSLAALFVLRELTAGVMTLLEMWGEDVSQPNIPIFCKNVLMCCCGGVRMLEGWKSGKGHRSTDRTDFFMFYPPESSCLTCWTTSPAKWNNKTVTSAGQNVEKKLKIFSLRDVETKNKAKRTVSSSCWMFIDPNPLFFK